MANSLYWHDYETWGPDPRRDRPAQFAGIRTDEDLNELGPPKIFYCRSTWDWLPSPESCLITRLTPQGVDRCGLGESEFALRVHEELAQPGTCGLGYNSIHFDDEVSRFLFYRNFLDPYGREWQSGNSRWDLIDLVRLTRALRPQGIHWPDYEDGRPDFRLESLVTANDLEQGPAHEALADVRASIALARLIRRQQPRLYDYVYRQRDKESVKLILAKHHQRPLLHASGRYPGEFCGVAPVLPLVQDPRPPAGILVYALRQDPEPFLALSAAELRRSLFTPRDELPPGMARPPLKTVHYNRCPVLAPMSTLTPEAMERLAIDPGAIERHRSRLLAAADFAEKVVEALREPVPRSAEDPDLALYNGFLPDADKAKLALIRSRSPEELAEMNPGFRDKRLPELLFRYRARNWPDSLSSSERGRWDEFRRQRLGNPAPGVLGFADFYAELERLRTLHADEAGVLPLLQELDQYAGALKQTIGGN